MSRPEFLIVGSGASAVHAALPLVKAGRQVVMLDAAQTDERYTPSLPAKDFRQLRENDPNQHRYFLGDDFEGIPFGPIRVGAQLTPPRQHIMALTERFLPHRTAAGGGAAFHLMQSLALGGLGAGWGASSPLFTDLDLSEWPISRALLQPHYEEIAVNIGLCGAARDDVGSWMGGPVPLLPPARVDSNGEEVMRRYRSRRSWFRDRGLHAGHAWLAACTRRHHGRGPLRYLDMEFYGDTDRAIYRPRYTVEELQRYPNFKMLRGYLAEVFEESPGGVTLGIMNLENGVKVQVEADRLILAAGAIGSAWIVLRSLGKPGQRLPLVANPYTYFPCLMWSRLGRVSRDRRHSLTQVLMYFDPEGRPGEALQAQLYSYRSLLQFKLIKETPLPIKEAIPALRALQEYFVVLGVHHPDRPTPGKYLELDSEGEQPVLSIHYEEPPSVKEERLAREKELLRLLPRLGALPLKRIDPGEGSSIHYGGTLPMTAEERPFTTTPAGRLRGTQRVYIADGATFPSLPAKGLTLTLMANARRVACGILHRPADLG